LPPDAPGTRPLGALIRALEERGLLRAFLPTGGARPADVAIRGVAADSRQVVPGSLFVAVRGERVDGHDFAVDAVAAGAAALLAERAVPGVAVPQLLVPASRPALALAAAWFHDFPSRRLGVVGVTGTDGKTTTCYMVREIGRAHV
jgi:UDP-N-acetylmuramoyl-L-alanyl-D-glutamate--2,6-diaminopimelate ligase